MSRFYRHGRILLLAAIAAIGAQTARAQQQTNYTGDGGKGISLTIYVPQSTGLANNQSYIPALVQGEFVSNFSNYSAISILDWERLDDIYVKLVNEAYDDNAAAKQDVILGRLAPTSHFLTGNITKTATGYNIKMNITATADKMTVATYSGTFSFAELDNLTGVRRASLELLQKVGVTLTEKARQELWWGAADANQVLAQTALAKGVTAQRAGTEVAALSYYFQAAALDTTLVEASKRSSMVSANISSGNVGADVRNEILWRKNWIAKLKETEETFYKMINTADLPYTMFYSTNIARGKINYQKETADFSIEMGLLANSTWFIAMERALQAAQAVLDGLNATKKKKEWGLATWPQQGVSNTNPFASTTSKRYDIALVFELVNQQGRVIGSKAFKITPDFKITLKNNSQFAVTFSNGYLYINFNDVRADEISDNLTIRIASINGAPPENARFAIVVMNEKTQPLIDIRDGKTYNTVKIMGKTWMAENLNYRTEKRSCCYENKTDSCQKYGRLYDWNTAMSVCPTGWHLPSLEEWDELVRAVNVLSSGNAGKKLKSKNGWYKNGNGTDDYGFSVLPSGQRNYHEKGFDKSGNSGSWWTATALGRGHAYNRSMGYDYNGVYQGNYSKNYGFSVRCVAD